jgi:hypothetical protein
LLWKLDFPLQDIASSHPQPPPQQSTQLLSSNHSPTMPLLVPGLVEPQSKKQDKKEQDKKDQTPQPKLTEQQSPAATQTSTDSSDKKKVDGRSAPGMEGMSDEAVKKFEEAMELEYQKREGGA